MAEGIGACRLVRELGQGSMGTVYLAERADGAFQKQVAIKVLRAGLAESHLAHHFQQERKIVASLDHPGIVRLLDAGTTPDGLPYFVMEYADGVPLTVWCDRHRLDVTARLQ